MNNNRDIYEVLDAIRKRPPLYFGTNTSIKSLFTTLIAFISGLQLSSMTINAGNPSYWEFSSWFPIKTGGSNTLPWDWAVATWGEEKAFEKFFELLDEYRNCEYVYLFRAIVNEHQPNIYRQTKHGQRIEVQKPLELFIGQYAPSSVFYLLEVYLDKHEKYVPHHNSPDRAKELAKSRWNVLEDDWIDFV